MLPSLAAEDLRRALAAYLTTSFALGDDDVREELEVFLERPESRLFRGPYLRVRTPFREAEPGWQRLLDWWPRGFTPYTHQAAAWQRLSTKAGHAPEPTIVTTGTGSGKTESFLVPILDHCARAKAEGQKGVKALLLYPMNALADDQARRIDELLATEPALGDVTAGIYIGGASGTRSATDEDEDDPASYARDFGATSLAGDPTVTRLITEREEIRADPPDILLTNYKMLDLLLQRISDVHLWTSGSLTYVVLDEFHTYDGAQGTDVAMLLRRLGAATASAREGQPLGDITPVATSATLGSSAPLPVLGEAAAASVASTAPAGDDAVEVPGAADRSDRELLLEFAGKVFGRPFPETSLIGEDRQRSVDVVTEPDFTLPTPSPAELAALPDPLDDSSGLDAFARLVLGLPDARDPFALADRLRQHNLVKAILDVAGETPVTVPDIAREFAKRGGGAPWDEAARADPGLVERAFARLLALISHARTRHPKTGKAVPFLRVEAQLWVREVRRVIRSATPEPHFRWFDDDGPTGDTAPNPANLAVYQRSEIDSAGEPDGLDPDVAGPIAARRPVGPPFRRHLPAVYCRHCGRSGWAALSTELEWQQLKTNTLDIYRASAQGNRAVRWMLRARDGEGPLLHLHAEEERLLANPTHETVAVITPLGPLPASLGDTCPACGLDDGMRFLGAGTATLASVATTQLFSDRGLHGDERKLLVFTDSVQDATHRAAFIANRSFGFTFRGLLSEQLRVGEPVAVHDLASNAADAVVAAAGRGSRAKLAAIVPPDLRENPDILTLLDSSSEFSEAGAEMLHARMVFQTLLEFGLRSRLGRTLELTRTAAAEVLLPDLPGLCALLRDRHQRIPGQITLPPDEAEYAVYLRGLVERLRLRGALYHPWLAAFIAQGGARRWPVWGGRPTGMPAFPRGMAAPRFPVAGGGRTTEFDSLTREGTWFADWGRRVLGCELREARALAEQAMRLLAQQEVLATYPGEAGETVYALRPRNVLVHRISDAESDGVAHPEDLDANACGVRCDTCTWRHTVPPNRRRDWLGTPCLRYQCPGRFIQDDRDYSTDYYRHLYTVDRPGDVLTAEHTGALSRRRREQVEQAFKHRASPFDPNVLTCTPTLELGIDIGDLSAVLLASLPPAPANYAQRIGRAGRSTGNSLTVTFVPRGSRNHYFLHAPERMLAGRIIPPDCYLDASEILRRQYLAFLLDRAADASLWQGTVMPERPMPPRIGELFGAGLAEDGWFRRFLDVAGVRHTELAAAFAALFPGMSGEALQSVQQFAAGGLEEAVAVAANAWNRRLAALRARMRQIGRAFDDLSTASGDPERDRQRRQLYAEQKSVRRRRDTLVGEHSLNALVRLGLLPNYTLHDDATVLEATLWWRNSDGEFEESTTDYGRGSRLALSELAPGNYFHSDGYKFVVDGLDLGPAVGGGEDPYALWRFCPECGFVATEETGPDLASCPRCGATQIADPGAVHKVLVPERVLARERREDARLTDERDERERKAFDVLTLVDIDRKQPQGLRAWRRTGSEKAMPFGVEFARVATIRTVNLGPSMAPGPEHVIAGQEVRTSGFETCLECGAVRGTHPQAWDRVAQRIGVRHAHWCSHREDGIEHEPVERLLLAHELTTQALRILLPVSTMDLADRMTSFKAALLLGVTRYFGGEPDHIRVVEDSMPGDSRELRRRFLVLHDSMPGGTGYLEHLARPQVMHRVLTLAQQVLRECPCRDEMRSPCHRCLLPFVSSSEHPHVSVRVARELLDEILQDWGWEPVDTLSGVRIDQLADSELEAQFVRTLLAWGSRDEEPGSVAVRAGRQGVEHELRFTRPDGGTTRWLMRDHVRMDTAVPCEPDFLLRRTDAGTQVAVFLDGYAFHASPRVNRIADDAVKRAALRAQGIRVWQLTWDDVRSWVQAVEGAAAGQRSRAAVRDLHAERALSLARSVHQQLVGQPRRDDTLDPALRNPVETLLEFLADPDDVKWARRAAGLLAGFGAVAPRPFVDRRQMGTELTGVLAGAAPTASAHATDAVAVDARTASGLRILGLLDRRPEPVTRRPGMLAWSTLILLDDSKQGCAEEAHRDRWADWLRWSCLLQFLEPAPSTELPRSFHQLALSTAEQVDPHTVALLTAALPTDSGAAAPLPAEWAEAVSWASSELESVLRELAQRAPNRVPEVGFELGDAAVVAELAWRDERIAVFVAEGGHGPEVYEQHGWRVLHAGAVDVAELVDMLEKG
ncbi:DEAD/DEAH box helicase [Kitasatospora cathayae]|uniref:DEAD/DEAH box helicase n=1 Tax=Kitasatospora cathayae TaxID=3004092 RepID=A0ABY7QBA4_9ACTN|nr:DEAD/DEAH box helicase [Kitasatospora sp. HUAS 3-15]WBP89960.1 DEAD/DEAH box helicase [Kitasatospora sp. HUAS 3-15]